MFRSLFMALLLVGLLSVGGVAPVAAADPTTVYNKVVNSANPEATYNSLTSAQKAALEVYLTPSKTTVSSFEIAQPQVTITTKCRELGHVVIGTNIVGVLLWTWYQIAEVCYDGSRIIYNHVRNYGQTHTLFWSWRLSEQWKTINTVVNPDKLTAFGQGEMKMCMFSDIGCIQFNYPWIEMRFWANGSFAYRYGG